ncbi:DUF4082 domain-containing protein [Saccharothrix sp. S26]|uniref:DUF4082 domain-containing protein n=1 Tax=Saccharothrix sp. S26 TaxID=2907215 RepID=UPI001F22C94C|nr:DUF4082 domain-containing protein [Saccharothrix sp. S26]MCE6996455.1 DUF4082 domain-containing protein [Saccharothrix sp. S26]
MKRILAVAAALLLIGPLLTGTAQAAPVTAVYTPTHGSTVAVGVPVLIAGTAVNGESGDVTGVEISFDDGRTWLPTEHHNESWLHHYTPVEPGPVTYHLRASSSRDVSEAYGPYEFFAGGTAAPPALRCPYCTLSLPWLPNRPERDDPDQAAVELGLRLSFDRAGYVAGAMVHRGTYTGPLTVHLWSATGTLLAETVSGSDTAVSYVRFPNRVPVAAGQEYVVSYFAPVGGYASTEDYFSAAMVIAPYTMGRAAGVYSYGGGFPTETWHDSNYWVHPTFELT